ncbi:DsrE family protein [Wenyingzhuangia sp. IMCC45533]
MSKKAIVLLSDPKSGSEESIGRLFNALGTAWEYKNAGQEVKFIFQGTATRWPEILENEKHPAHKLYKELADVIEGASAACAQVWGANPSGLDLIKNNTLPGTVGSSSFLKLEEEGFTILTF